MVKVKNIDDSIKPKHDLTSLWLHFKNGSFGLVVANTF